jgi:hypothetical protein
MTIRTSMAPTIEERRSSHAGKRTRKGIFPETIRAGYPALTSRYLRFGNLFIRRGFTLPVPQGYDDLRDYMRGIPRTRAAHARIRGIDRPFAPERRERNTPVRSYGRRT